MSYIIEIIFTSNVNINIIVIMLEIFVYLIFSNVYAVEKGVIPTLVQ